MIIEKLHSDASGVVGPTEGGKPWLNSLDEVNAIVEHFSHQVLKRFGEDGEAFMPWLESETRALNSVFLGPGLEERPYATDPAWNNPDKLGTRVLLRLGINGENRHAVRDAFMVLADELTDVVIKHGDEPIADWGWELGALRERTARALLDMPAGSDEDPDPTGDTTPLAEG